MAGYYFDLLLGGILPRRWNSSFGFIPVVNAMRFESANNATIAPISQASSLPRPCCARLA